MMPLVFKRRGGGEIHVNPWHIGLWQKVGDHSEIVVQGQSYLLEDGFEEVNKAIRESDAPE